MLIKKFCFLICAIFLFKSLCDICKDSQSVQYIKSNETVEIFNFSFCIGLDKELLKNFKKPSDNRYQFTVKELVESTCYEKFSNYTCNNLIDLNRSYLFNYHSCLVFKGEDFDTLIRNLFTTVDFYIFAFPNYLSEVFFYKNVFRNVVTKLEPFTLVVDYYVYHQLESPYETDCYHYSNEKLNFKTNEIVVSRASCLYECFKTESRSLSYYYSTRDDRPLITDKNDLEKFKKIGKLRTIDENFGTKLEEKCSNECKKRSCKLEFNLVKDFKGTKQEIFNLTYNLFIYSAIPLVTKTQTIINFISLIVLFLNISIYETIPYLIKKYLINYFKTPLSLFIKYYWLLKLIVFILCLLIIIYLSLFRIFEYSSNYFIRFQAFNFPAEISPFYLMICVPIQVLIDNNDRLEEEKEKNLLKTNSFIDLENLTNFDKFKLKLERIYIEYASIEKEVDYSIDQTKIVFHYFDYGFENYTMTNFLLRCYKIDMNIKELRYEMLYSLSKLKIILKFNWFIIYPIPKDFNLTTKSGNLIYDPYLYKRIYKEKFNCTNYSKNKSLSNLSDKYEGIDQCINEQHLNNYGHLTIQSVIYKETIPREYELNQIYFNQNIDQNISNECEKSFDEYNCLSQYFVINKRKPVNQINETFSMNLHYVEYITNDNIILSLSDLLLNNLLSFESIFIGLNIGKILLILFILLKRYKLNRLVKYYNYFKFIILLIGLTFHLYYIIDDILNSEHILIANYSPFKSIQLPNIIFCFKIQNYSKIDFNHKQTTSYLDNFTRNLNLNFFKTVSFLDNKYKEKLSSPNQSEIIENFDKINTIYFLNLKCFEFIIKSTDNIRYSKILNDQHFISFKFNREIVLKYFNSSNFDFYLITRKNSTNELNGIEKLNFNYDENDHSLIRFYLKLTILKVKEKFTFFHNPLSILFDQVNLDDSTKYIKKLFKGFNKFKLKTIKIMKPINLDHESIHENLEYDEFADKNLEYDDEMFDQYFHQIKNVTDFNSFKILNYKKKIYITKIIKSKSKYDKNYDVKFFLYPLLEKYTLTNRDNYSKFIISILNCLNIWLNFCCLDLYIYLQKLGQPINKFYQIVISFKFYLKQKKSNILLQNL